MKRRRTATQSSRTDGEVVVKPEQEQTRPKRRPYVSPRLKGFGLVKEITRGGAVSVTEGVNCSPQQNNIGEC